MKKALSLILALVMIFALATVAFADTKHVVGTYGDHKSGTTDEQLSDGVWPFAVTPPSVNVDIKVTAVTTVHKYAVDIEYDASAISLGGGTITWNVNTMTYETSGVTGGTTPQEWKVTIKNYSDLPVWTWAVVTDDTPDSMSVTADYYANHELKIEKATAGTGGSNGTLTDEDITFTLAPESLKTWADVVEYYTINHPGAPSVTAATATIRVAAEDPTP